jgi:hypothetical protein
MHTRQQRGVKELAAFESFEVSEKKESSVVSGARIEAERASDAAVCFGNKTRRDVGSN